MTDKKTDNLLDTMTPSRKISTGVEELINQLRAEGIETGRLEADKLVKNAKAEAREIVAKAEKEAAELKRQADRHASETREILKQDITQALRDAVESVKEDLEKRLLKELRGLVKKSMATEETLGKLLLALAGETREGAGMDDAEKVTIELPKTPETLEKVGKKGESEGSKALSELMFGISTNMLREGVSLSLSDELAAGFRIRLEDKGIVIDLTDEAVSELLARFIHPRFRSYLDRMER